MSELDEETQLAIALALSEAEVSGKPLSQQRGPRPSNTSSDADLARELQRQFDQEASAASRKPPSNPNTSPYPVAGKPVVPPRNNTTNRGPPTAPSTSGPGHCAGCHQPLAPQRLGLLSSLVPQSTSYLNALGRNWHPSCFVCTGCRQPLAGHFTVSDRQEPHCKRCHQESFHPRCAVCKGFLPEEGGNRIVWQVTPFWGDKTCPEHFKDGTKRCTACTKLQPRGEFNSVDH